MSQPEPLSVDDALDRLVNQFSDKLAFFRELIQNALDAGSEEVEVWFEHRDQKLMVIHVDDWGAGMNREIIDTRLTRLFSSSKDGDLTKIGKFGIGFVSVFAIEPEAVSIDTSRDGEHWRIVFDDKRRFTLIRRDEPVEGTKIEIYKRATRAEFAEFSDRATDVVRYWCKHVAGEVRVGDALINQAFDLDAPCKVRHEGDQDLVVVGHPRDGESFAGFYNRGLTLVETQLRSGIAFKASSTKLEHTLTRDDVIREAGFHRLMGQIDELIAGELCVQVFTELEHAVRELDPQRGLRGLVVEPDSNTGDDDRGRRPDQAERLAYLWAAAKVHVDAGHARVNSPNQALFVSPSGAPIGWAGLRKPRKKRVILARGPSPLTEVLEAEGETVVWIPDQAAAGLQLLASILGAAKVESVPVDRWCTALPPRDSDEAVRWQVLASALATLLDDWGAKIGGVRLGHFDSPSSSIRARVAITQGSFGEATPVAEAAQLGTGLLSSRRVVVLNADHPSVRTIAALAQTEPELGAYFALKAFLVGDGVGDRLDAETSEALAVATHDRRLLRVGMRGQRGQRGRS